MPRSSGTVVENNFVNGLVSEATALNFPENACTSASNVVFKETGEVTRRYGFDYETAYQLNSVTKYNSAIVEYEWKAAGGSGEFNFVVQQIGDTIRLYRADLTNSLSSGLHATTFSLATYQVPGSPSPNDQPCAFASGKGYLFVTNKYCEPFYVSYDTATNTFTATQLTLTIRDFEGVEDGLTMGERPLTLSDAHNYNLKNQGWGYDVKTHSGAVMDPIEYWANFRADYPSNSDIWWVYRDSTNEFNYSSIAAYAIGSTPAPKGYYIYNAFDTDRSVQSGISGLTELSAGYNRPSCCAFFAGRVWYAGVEAQGYIGSVYYTQIIETDAQLGLCYQRSDPTAEEFSDLLDTDGGIARVLDMGTVHRMVATQKALLIFASNGIWSISGSDVASFKATDYTIKKITSTSVTSGLSFVDVLGSPVFWTEDGIWTVAYEAGDFTLVSVSDKKIKQYFKDIPRESKKWAKGSYNSIDKIVYWVYRSTEPTTIDDRYTYDKVLVLNTTTGAFYPWTISSATKNIHGVIACQGPLYNTYNEVIDGSSNTVIDASSNTVITFSSSEASQVRFFVSKNVSGTTYNTTFAVVGNTSYVDWAADSENADYTSSFITGYRVHADGNRQYQSNYLTIYLKDDTGSSAYLQGIWDYSNNTASKKWTTAQQIYNSTPTYRDYRVRKIKIRGWGLSCQFKVYSVSGLPFHVVGWSSFETANPLP